MFNRYVVLNYQSDIGCYFIWYFKTCEFISLFFNITNMEEQIDRSIVLDNVVNYDDDDDEL